jgi:conjugal transfer pilus assembly protein TrbC
MMYRRLARQEPLGHSYPATFACLFLLALALSCLPASTRSAEPPSEVSPHLYVFISSSMPAEALRIIARDSATLDAPLVLRGLIGASLQETLLNLKDVAAEGAELEVDPMLFEAYGVEAVPAVVLTCGSRGEGPFALVYGLVPSQAFPRLRKALPRC